MDDTALLEESKTEVLTVNQRPSLYEVCQQLTDGRKARGKRYDLAGILLVVVWAKLAGMSSIIIKDNTPSALSDLELFFEDQEADRQTWQAYSQCEKGHGRLERRSILTSPDLNGLFFQDWGEIGQVFRLQRERTSKGKHSCEVRYGLTTLSQHRCPPQRLLGYIRAHWKVENHLHWRRDALLGEDRCRVRCIPVMEMLAVLNTVILSLMQLHQVSTVARQLRWFAFHPAEALPWLFENF